jgi:hypothetical protein
LFDWLTSVISDGDYVGILLLMLAENLFPPIPSELIMPLAGFWPPKASSTSGLSCSPESSDLCLAHCHGTTPDTRSERRACAPSPPATAAG